MIVNVSIFTNPDMILVTGFIGRLKKKPLREELHGFRKVGRLARTMELIKLIHHISLSIF